MFQTLAKSKLKWYFLTVISLIFWEIFFAKAKTQASWARQTSGGLPWRRMRELMSHCKRAFNCSLIEEYNKIMSERNQFETFFANSSSTLVMTLKHEWELLWSRWMEYGKRLRYMYSYINGDEPGQLVQPMQPGQLAQHPPKLSSPPQLKPGDTVSTPSANPPRTDKKTLHLSYKTVVGAVVQTLYLMCNYTGFSWKKTATP